MATDCIFAPGVYVDASADIPATAAEFVVAARLRFADVSAADIFFCQNQFTARNTFLGQRNTRQTLYTRLEDTSGAPLWANFNGPTVLDGVAYSVLWKVKNSGPMELWIDGALGDSDPSTTGNLLQVPANIHADQGLLNNTTVDMVLEGGCWISTAAGVTGLSYSDFFDGSGQPIFGEAAVGGYAPDFAKTTPAAFNAYPGTVGTVEGAHAVSNGGAEWAHNYAISPGGSQTGTLALWFKLDALPAARGTIFDLQLSGSKSLELAVFDNGKIDLEAGSDASDSLFVRRSDVNAVSVGVWHHFAASWDYSTASPVIDFYLDGAPLASTFSVTNAGPDTLRAPNRVAVFATFGGGNMISGALSDLFYDHVYRDLSAEIGKFIFGGGPVSPPQVPAPIFRLVNEGDAWATINTGTGGNLSIDLGGSLSVVPGPEGGASAASDDLPGAALDAAPSLTGGTLAQAHGIGGDALDLAASITGGTLAQAHGIGGGNVVALPSITGGALAQAHGLGGDALDLVPSITGGTLAQAHGIGGDALDLAPSITGGTLAQAHGIGGGNVVALPSLEGGATAASDDLPGAALDAAPALTGGAIAQAHGIGGGNVVALPSLEGGATVALSDLPGGALDAAPALTGGTLAQAHGIGGGNVVALPSLEGGATAASDGLPGAALDAAPSLTGGAFAQGQALGGGNVVALPSITGGALAQAHGLGGDALDLAPALTGGTLAQAHGIGGGNVVALPSLAGGSAAEQDLRAGIAVAVSGAWRASLSLSAAWAVSAAPAAWRINEALGAWKDVA